MEIVEQILLRKTYHVYYICEVSIILITNMNETSSNKQKSWKQTLKPPIKEKSPKHSELCWNITRFTNSTF